MTRSFIALLLLLAFSPTAHAQLASADARFSVGIAVDRLFTLDDDASDTWGVGPLFRIGPDRGGWGPAVGFGWFAADLPASVGGVTGDFAQLKVRPVMGGISYTIRRGPWSYDIGLTAGWTFNSATLLPAAERYFESVGAGPVDVEVSNGFAARPRLRVYYDTSTRVALMGAAGVLFVDPEVTLRSGSQSLTFDRNLTSFTLEAGIVFALF